MAKTIAVEQEVQRWGNSNALRLPQSICRAARIDAGQPVSISVVDGGVFVKVTGKPRLSLDQKLKLFNPNKHGGEIGANAGLVGAEVL